MNIKSQIEAIVEWMSDEDLEQYKGRPSRKKRKKSKEEIHKEVIAQSDQANARHAQEGEDRRAAIRRAGGKGLPGPVRYKKPYKKRHK